jgi:alpha-tubulin suppressor-like RCC1 family protein/pimeloyl-ACP methyl ester carboxylesterase
MGDKHACSIFGGGKVACWGDNRFGQLGDGTTLHRNQPVLVSGITNALAVAAGGEESTAEEDTLGQHTCALRANGAVWCWGANSYGQLGNGTTTASPVPVAVNGISTATAIAVGTEFSCALLSTGQVKCWGKNPNGQLGNGTKTASSTPVTVSGITTATGIGTGSQHGCARLGDSTLKCWGLNSSGQLGNGTLNTSSTPVTVSGITTATAVGGGFLHTCARLSTGSVKCWGLNSSGQLGNNSTNNSSSPVSVSSTTTASHITLGYRHSCARLTDGSVRCWGGNVAGQLGNNSTNNSSVPVTATGVTGASTVVAGGQSTCALLTAGGFRCWGSDEWGQLNHGSASYQGVPMLVQGTTLNNVVDVGGGYQHTCALLNTGGVKCWGENTYGQLGTGNTTDSSTPVAVAGISTATAIFAGGFHTCALLSDTTVKCWGAGSFGQLGYPSGFQSNSPVGVLGLTGVIAIGGSRYHTCAVLSDSTAKCWGYNAYGQLGNGSQFNSTTPVVVTGLTGAVSIAGGGSDDNPASEPTAYHTCALLSTGGAKCWGDNRYGQLGDGTTTWTPTPVTVSGLSGATRVSLGYGSTCAALSTGGVKCWGYNASGQLGNGNTTNSKVPVDVSGISTATGADVGRNHACAALADRTVKCWGGNTYGQLGDGTMANSSVPVAATGVTSASLVATAEHHTCARQIDSTIKCWGYNLKGQLGDGHLENNLTAVTPNCSTVAVERSDYFVNITTANMPDPQFNGLAGQLDVHRVAPVLFPETCTVDKALVLVHGRSVEATTVFDLPYEDYSFQENLAKVGIDTFAMNHLGFGRSSGFGAMDNACNASLPSCTAIGQTCPPQPGVLCDCGFGPQSIDQQGAVDPLSGLGRWLNPNPLATRCAHTTTTRFINTTTMVASLDAVIDDALAKTGLPKVNLLGYSAGGPDVINYLGDSNGTVRAAHSAKIERAIMVSPIFGAPLSGLVEPNTATTVPSFPLAVNDRGGAVGGFNLLCDGQLDLAVQNASWGAQKARDYVGQAWGGANAGNLALNKAATGSTPCSPDEGPEKAFNGSVSGGTTDKFCSAATPSMLQVDLGQAQPLTNVTIHHAGAGGEGSLIWNTRAFDIQTSLDGTNWTTALTVTDNTLPVSSHALPTMPNARYVRLNVSTPSQNGDSSTRIYELEVFGNYGLVRYSVATRWGSNGANAARFSIPTLVMVGENDNVATAAASDALYNKDNVANAGLPAISKTLVKMQCASHAIFFETCINTGNRVCNNSRGPHESLKKNAIDWIKTGMIYASPGSTTGTFGTTDDGANFHDPAASPVQDVHEENAL